VGNHPNAALKQEVMRDVYRDGIGCAQKLDEALRGQSSLRARLHTRKQDGQLYELLGVNSTHVSKYPLFLGATTSSVDYEQEASWIIGLYGK
jgi:hypothetical protein